MLHRVWPSRLPNVAGRNRGFFLSSAPAVNPSHPHDTPSSNPLSPTFPDWNESR